MGDLVEARERDVRVAIAEGVERSLHGDVGAIVAIADAVLERLAESSLVVAQRAPVAPPLQPPDALRRAARTQPDALRRAARTLAQFEFRCPGSGPGEVGLGLEALAVAQDCIRAVLKSDAE